MAENEAAPDRPVVVITGAKGQIGLKLTERLRDRYTVVELDRPPADDDPDSIAFDLTDETSVSRAFEEVAERHGRKIASVVHLAAYFDFTGEESPLYDAVNVEGTRHLMRALREFEVEQFLYSGTMLVHEAVEPGELVHEETPVDPGWAYPKSKARAEAVIREERGDMPVVLLHLAGLYDDRTAVPTLSQQIARIYERRFKSHLHSGDIRAGQSFIHREDMLDLFEAAIDRRGALEPETVILGGEPEVMSYRALQDEIGRLIHGEESWLTQSVPRPVAKAGARIESGAEPLVPDALDRGEKPFIRPFLIDLSEDHYALDISRARDVLGWEPKHRIRDGLKSMVAALKADPMGWYEANGVLPPPWLQAAHDRVADVEALRAGHEAEYRERHHRSLWAHWVNAGLGVWLITSPPLLGYDSAWLAASDIVAGLAVLVLAVLSMSWRFWMARWATAAVGVWVMFSPLVFWAETGAGYLNGTLVGMLIAGLAVAVGPPPGVAPVAVQTGPTVPKGWTYSPSGWFQRLPVIILALVGLLISRYLASYQLETIPGVWDPVFEGTRPGLNGSEDIVTSSVSEAWPVPDAGLGAVTYALEILVGVVGSARRWRTMPWLVILFGIMIVPLGAVSVFFIVIQPILIGTYCTLCLVAAVAMLIQIPYSVDEVVATGQFLVRRHKAGQPWMRVLFTGDTDEGEDDRTPDDFEQWPGQILREMTTGGITLPPTLAGAIGVGLLLILSPLVLTWENPISATFHIAGALVLTISVTALAVVARLARLLNAVVGLVLLFAPFLTGVGLGTMAFAWLAGIALIALSVPRGPVAQSYGSWDRFVR